MNRPDKFLVIKIGTSHVIYKLFATFLGGYLDGDAWRLNSGITKVEQDETHIRFYGESGSCYECTKGTYGSNSYSQGVLDNMIKKAKEVNIDINVLPENLDFESFFNNDLVK